MKKEEFVKLLKNKGLQFIETEGKIKVERNLDLRGTGITSLPDNLAVGGWLDLEGCAGITSLPDNIAVGGSLDLRGTGITSLPDNLAVGGSLDLRGTGITSLPDNLAVGGSLDLEGCAGITSLPDNLAVGGSLYLRGTGITDVVNVNRNFKIDITKKIWEGKLYINCDGIFAKVESHHGNVWKVRKIAETESFYIVSDGAGNYAHGDTIEEARKDLVYKITGRDKSDYEGLPSDHIFTFEEAVKCYRTITGACAFGTRDFVENRLGEKKEKYSIEEIARLTEGEYGNMSFREFFNVN